MLLPALISWYSALLRAGRSGDGIPVGGRFSVPSIPDPRTTQRPVQWVNLPERDADHPPTSSAELANGFELYPASSLCLHRHVMGWPLPLPTLRSVDCCAELWLITQCRHSTVFSSANSRPAVCHRWRIGGKQVCAGVASAWAALPCRLYHCYRLLRVGCWFLRQGTKNENCPSSRSINGSRWPDA